MNKGAPSGALFVLDVTGTAPTQERVRSVETIAITAR